MGLCIVGAYTIGPMKRIKDRKNHNRIQYTRWVHIKRHKHSENSVDLMENNTPYASYGVYLTITYYKWNNKQCSMRACRDAFQSLIISYFLGCKLELCEFEWLVRIFNLILFYSFTVVFLSHADKDGTAQLSSHTSKDLVFGGEKVCELVCSQTLHCVYACGSYKSIHRNAALSCCILFCSARFLISFPYIL